MPEILDVFEAVKAPPSLKESFRKGSSEGIEDYFLVFVISEGFTVVPITKGKTLFKSPHMVTSWGEMPFSIAEMGISWWRDYKKIEKLKASLSKLDSNKILQSNNDNFLISKKDIVDIIIRGEFSKWHFFRGFTFKIRTTKNEYNWIFASNKKAISKERYNEMKQILLSVFGNAIKMI